MSKGTTIIFKYLFRIDKQGHITFSLLKGKIMPHIFVQWVFSIVSFKRPRKWGHHDSETPLNFTPIFDCMLS